MDFLEKKADSGQAPSLLFEIDCPKFTVNQPPEFQYWRLFGGKTAMFVVQYSYRGETISDEKRAEILDILKKAYLKQEKK